MKLPAVYISSCNMEIFIIIALLLLGFMSKAENVLNTEDSIGRSDFMCSPVTDDSNNTTCFINGTERNVSIQIGKTAYLRCRVVHIGTKTVAWVRLKDSHILTVGAYTYTYDQRFIPIHGRNSEIWTLKIRYPQKKDAGAYACLVVPETNINLTVMLNVFESGAEISEGPNLFVSCDSTISMTCIITGGTSPPDHVTWYRNYIQIGINSPRGGIKVTAENKPTPVSRMSIENATVSDSGTYSCRPSNAAPANIEVYVLDSGNCQTNSTALEDHSTFLF